MQIELSNYFTQNSKTSKLFRLIFLLLILCTFLLTTGCKQSKSQQRSNFLPHIIVGSDTYPPFAFEDTDGQATGIDIEIATEAFKRIGYVPDFKFINWEDKTQLLESGQIDCIWSCFTMNGRQDSYQWTIPYMESRQIVAVRSDSTIYTLEDLKDKIIAVQSSTKPEELLLKPTENRQLPQVAEVFALQNRELLYSFLSKGYVDAIAAHETMLIQGLNDYGVSYRILDKPLLAVSLGVAFAKNDDSGFAQRLSFTIDAMKSDGTIERIKSKYLIPQDKTTE